jgi:hypothetical protein
MRPKIQMPFLFVAMMLASLTEAGAAPDALKGKTITVSWTEVRQEKVDSLDSNMTSITVNFSLKAYVSEQGRAFTRMSRNGGPGSSRGDQRHFGRQTTHDSDQGPTDANAMGTAGAVNFAGQRMTVTRAFSNGARQVSPIFDRGFASCRAQIVVGKAGGNGFVAVTSMSQRREYIFSSSVSGESCSIAAGNDFSH